MANFSNLKEFISALNSSVANIGTQYNRQSALKTKQLALKDIANGYSPVEYGGRSPRNSGSLRKYKGYSKFYKDLIKAGVYNRYGKRTSPVNLKLSGKMLKSFKVITHPNFTSTLVITDPKAVIHNQTGTKRGKIVRRLLPTAKGETFHSSIRKEWINMLNRIVTQRLLK